MIQSFLSLLEERNSIKPSLFPYLGRCITLCFYYFLMRPRSPRLPSNGEGGSEMRRSSVATSLPEREERMDRNEESGYRNHVWQPLVFHGRRFPFAASIPRRGRGGIPRRSTGVTGQVTGYFRAFHAVQET